MDANSQVHHYNVLVCHFVKENILYRLSMAKRLCQKQYPGKTTIKKESREKQKESVIVLWSL